VLSFSGALKILVAIEATDMRKSYNGLQAIVSQKLKEDIRGGTLFVFSNRRHTRLKILYWDGSGLWVLAKRLEKGSFSWPQQIEPGENTLKLKAEALAMLTDGIELKGAKMRPWYQRE
jgi:transposase